jgi:zinc protease
MIKYSRFRLNNGLRVLVHEDRSTPLVAMTILYDVGSKDEDPGSTGLAHLFEHLMFGGTPRVPEFDRHLQLSGGENNAFTSNDITCYYITLPSANIETGFWLEADRMTELDFSEKNLGIQKNVVVEEFKQRYLNQPYGDIMLILKPLAYKVHPYRWPTIGIDPKHILDADLEKIKSFFFSHYAPNNAILSLTGNITAEKAFRLSEKWFGPIENRKIKSRKLPAEPVQRKSRAVTVERDVPASAVYKAWHSCGRADKDFITLDLITDILAGGESGRLHTSLVRGKKLFSEINTYLSSDVDPGLIILHGKLMKGIEIDVAENAVNEIIEGLFKKLPSPSEMEKIRNKFESACIYGNTNILNKALNLSFNELLGNPEMINLEVELYRKVSREMVVEAAHKYFDKGNCSTVCYKSTRNDKS